MIIRQINTIQAHNKNPIFDQIVSYVNINYGILYKNEFESIKNDIIPSQNYSEVYEPLYTFGDNS